MDSQKDFAFTTNCEYEFIYKDSLIGYSSRDLKFYRITLSGGTLSKLPLSKEEVQNIFPSYKVISLSEFSKKTNSYKIKKRIGDLKIILFNDSDKTFENYSFTSGNAKFEQYDLKGFITVSKPGMIQFSGLNDSLSDNNWYMLLVR